MYMEEAAPHFNTLFDFCREFTLIYELVNIILDDEEVDKSSKNQNLFVLICWHNCGPNS